MRCLKIVAKRSEVRNMHGFCRRVFLYHHGLRERAKYSRQVSNMSSQKMSCFIKWLRLIRRRSDVYKWSTLRDVWLNTETRKN
jgi:hypothetical protein